MKLEFQKTEMQYMPKRKVKSNKEYLADFLKNNFKMPDNNLNEIVSFINEDSELEKIIWNSRA